jgi:hypothetical protein
VPQTDYRTAVHNVGGYQSTCTMHCKKQKGSRKALPPQWMDSVRYCTVKIICVPLSRWTFEFFDVNVAELELEADDVRLSPRIPTTP